MKYFLSILITITHLFADYSSTTNASTLGMYYQDYNSMMAMCGILSGAIIMFGMIFLTIKVGSK